jgi:hypothetical protein
MVVPDNRRLTHVREAFFVYSPLTQYVFYKKITPQGR